MLVISKTFGGLTQKKLDWMPHSRRWQDDGFVHFFKEWKEAPTDSLYHILGKEICRIASKFKRGFRGSCGCTVITEYRGRKRVFDIDVEQGTFFDDFTHIECIRVRSRRSTVSKLSAN